MITLKLKDESKITPEVQEWLDKTSKILSEKFMQDYMDQITFGISVSYVNDKGENIRIDPREMYK